ncbi:MAG: phospholipase D family protein [Bacteroidota bacterium]
MPRKTKKAKLKPTILVAFIIGGILGYEVGIYHQAASTALLSTPEATIQVRFSPGGRCTQLVEETITQAKKRVLVQAYGFTSLPIADALIAAHQRGVEVKILVDRSQLKSKYSQVRHVMKQGINVAVDKVPGIAHNKVMIIDDAYVLTGSFNWTQAAEKRNAENLLLIQDAKLNSIYAAKWQERAKRALAPELGK